MATEAFEPGAGTDWSEGWTPERGAGQSVPAAEHPRGTCQRNFALLSSGSRPASLTAANRAATGVVRWGGFDDDRQRDARVATSCGQCNCGYISTQAPTTKHRVVITDDLLTWEKDTDVGSR